MTKKSYLLTGMAVIMGCLYVYFFTDACAPKLIRIEHSVRPARDAWAGGNQRTVSDKRQPDNVTFALHREFKLTSIRVVPLAEFQTNEYAHPLWQLVSESGSRPTKALSYGFPVPEMAPPVPGAIARRLVPGVEYLLIVEAGAYRGERDFSIPVRAGVRR